MSLKIEAGKRYVTRDGRVTGPLRPTTDRAARSRYAYVTEMTEAPNARVMWTDQGCFNLFEYRSTWDLVAEFVEKPTEDNVNKAEKLNKLIDEIPVCSDGKGKIRALVQELTGEVLVKTQPKLKAGQVWRYTDSPGLRMITKHLGAVSLDTSPSVYTTDEVTRHIQNNWTFAANSLTEYLAQGGKL